MFAQHGEPGIERISDGHGKYSVAKVVERCPSYAQPLHVGFTYFVYEWPIEEYFPEGSNVGSALARPDTFMELARKAYTLSKSSPSWDVIAAKMLRAEPALASHVPEICKWVPLWAGEGEHPKYKTSLADYLSVVGKVFWENLTVGALKKVNSLDFGAGKGGHTRLMMLKAIRARSNISAAALQRFTSANSLALVTKGEADLVSCKKAVDKAVGGDQPQTVAKAIGDTEIAIAAYAIGMNKRV